MDSSHPISHSSLESNPHQDARARARAWAYVFDCYRKKEATGAGGPNDGTKSSKGNSAYERIIQ
jgi:hypothetical protein